MFLTPTVYFLEENFLGVGYTICTSFMKVRKIPTATVCILLPVGAIKIRSR